MATNQEIFEGKLDALADSINAKAGTSGKKNIDEMKSAVDSIVLPTITIEEIEGGHRIVITDRTGTRSCDVMDGVDGAPGESAPSYVLNWYANPTEAQKQANLTVMNTIRSLDPGSYSLYVINGNYIFPALYVSNSVSNPSFIGLSLQDGTSLKAFQFLGTDLASYQQASWDYVEQTTFDENSQNAGAMSIIASYIDEQVEAAKLIMGANLSSHSSNENIHVTAANKTAWDAKYDKPSGGIPKTDLAQGVQDTLDDVATIDSRIDDIEDVIPSAATTQNQLADKAFVNSSIATETANFVGTFASVAALEAYSGTLTNNDYAFVTQSRQEDPTQIIAYDRYKYNQSAQEWRFEYTLNNSSFTAAQWAAINSAITASLVTNYSAHLADTTVHVTSQNKTDWNAKYDKPSGGIPKTDLASAVQTSLTAADNAIPSSEKGVASGVAELNSSGKIPATELAGTTASLDTSRGVVVYDIRNGSTSWGSVIKTIPLTTDPSDDPKGYLLYTWIKKMGNEAVTSPESMARASFTINTPIDELIDTSTISDVFFGQPFQIFIQQSGTSDVEDIILILFDNGYGGAYQLRTTATINGVSHLNLSGTVVDVQVSLSGVMNDSTATTTITFTAIAHETKYVADPTSPSATPLVMPMVPAPVSGTLTLSSSSWTDNLDGTYSQSITITGSTNYSKIDLQPNAAVLSQLSADGVGAIYVTNQNNVLSAVAVGNAPTANLSVQYVMSAVYDGAVTPGGSTPQVVSITMPASWTDNSDGTYSQVITSLITTAGATLTSASKVDVQVSSSVVSQLTTDGVTGLYAQQNNGAVTMIMMGAEPSSTVTVQLTITETNVI